MYLHYLRTMRAGKTKRGLRTFTRTLRFATSYDVRRSQQWCKLPETIMLLLLIQIVIRMSCVVYLEVLTKNDKGK